MLFSFEMSRISNSISVSDSFAVLLDDSLKENQTLRQQLRQRDEENGAKFQELTNKVDSLCKIVAENNSRSGNKETKSKSSSKVHVPTRCRTEFRKIYKCLMEDDASFQGFYLEESATSARNKEAFSIVSDAISNDYGGVEECPWSPAQLKGAFATYLRSLKDGQKRKRSAGKLEHKIVCRRQGRVREKINRRVYAVDQEDWNVAQKERCKKFLTIEYTSSDESELSEDDNGVDVKRFVTKRLAWEGPQLRELKDLLDLSYKKLLKPHVRNFQTERVVGERLSTRGPPPFAPKWTLKSGSTPLATSTPARGRH